MAKLLQFHLKKWQLSRIVCEEASINYIDLFGLTGICKKGQKVFPHLAETFLPEYLIEQPLKPLLTENPISKQCRP